MHAIGLGVGGANLKAAHPSGATLLRRFALWRNPHGLGEALTDIVAALPSADSLAVTMTGELCDCYADKQEGVHAILDAVTAAAWGRPVFVWRADGRLVDVATARQGPARLVASANWLAVATWAGRLAPSGPALLIDIGSTTTDVVPLLDGAPVPCGHTDPERLHSQELVYVGVRRTPLCAWASGENWAAEFFATTLDVCLVLGLLPEDANDRDTADGRPATAVDAHRRLARMLCADLDSSSSAEREALARRVVDRIEQRLASAVDSVASSLPSPPPRVILSGSGEFLARQALKRSQRLPPGAEVVSVGETLGPGTSQAACAFALTVLAREAKVISPP